MKSIKEKAEEYSRRIASSEYTRNDFKAGANYVLKCIEEATNICFDEELIKVIEQLKK